MIVWLSVGALFAVLMTASLVAGIVVSEPWPRHGAARAGALRSAVVEFRFRVLVRKKFHALSRPYVCVCSFACECRTMSGHRSTIPHSRLQRGQWMSSVISLPPTRLQRNIIVWDVTSAEAFRTSALLACGGCSAHYSHGRIRRSCFDTCRGGARGIDLALVMSKRWCFRRTCSTVSRRHGPPVQRLLAPVTSLMHSPSTRGTRRKSSSAPSWIKPKEQKCPNSRL